MCGSEAIDVEEALQLLAFVSMGAVEMGAVVIITLDAVANLILIPVEIACSSLSSLESNDTVSTQTTIPKLS